MRYRQQIMLIVGAAMLSTTAFAQDDDRDEIAELKAQVVALMSRIEQLEQRADQGPAVAAAAAVEAVSAAQQPERVRLSGDLRYRHETINDDLSTERNRHRIRARMGLTADVSDDVTIGLTLASGEDNPISANQTLDTGFSRKDVGFDRAFFAWDVADNLTLRGGKMGNPFFRPAGHHLIFDSDLNPEGLSLSYEAGSFFANTAGYFADERGGGDDGILLAAQGGYSAELSGGAALTVGISYYDYRNTRGFAPFYVNDGFGNQLDANGNYLYDFDDVEIFAEASFDVGGQPLGLFADYVTNTAADAFDTGYAFGARYRRASAPGSWDIAWAYQDLEANAVIGAFTDSDFAGGGTDGKGNVFKGNYVLSNRLTLGLTYFLNETGAAAGNERDYKRLQADVNFRY